MYQNLLLLHYFLDILVLLLMRHRALLFGLLGALLAAAAFKPAWQGLALLAAWGSVLGFVLLAPTTLLPALQRVWWIDVALLPLLALASWAWWGQHNRA